ncbi:MAG: Smr/MutS family protein [Pseudomonadota bacterium]
MRRRNLTPSELKAWAAVTRSVRAMPGVEPMAMPTGMNTEPAEHAAGRPAKAKREPASAPAQGGRPQKPPVPQAMVADRAGEKKVRRGQVPFTARIDLHGMTQAEADRALRGFLSHHRSAGARCVLVITGKGRSGLSVLKRNFIHWLSSPSGRSLASGFAEAHARHGGGGAFYVWLRRTGAHH